MPPPPPPPPPPLVSQLLTRRTIPSMCLCLTSRPPLPAVPSSLPDGRLTTTKGCPCHATVPSAGSARQTTTVSSRAAVKRSTTSERLRTCGRAPKAFRRASSTHTVSITGVARVRSSRRNGRSSSRLTGAGRSRFLLRLWTRAPRRAMARTHGRGVRRGIGPLMASGRPGLRPPRRPRPRASTNP